MRTTKRDILSNERGLAMLEAVPLLVIFVVLMSFGMGFFGVIHTATLHSIAARAYSFETFRQRTNLVYFREDGSALAGRIMNFARKGWRFHAIQHETDQRDRFVPTTRPIVLGRSIAGQQTNVETHNQQIFEIAPRNERVSVNPVWVMVGYGICLNPGCGN